MAVLEVGLVERDAQLNTLRDWWLEAAAGHGRLVLVAGEAGAGKTSLIDAFRREVPGGVLAGLCEPLTTPAALGPVLDMAPDLPLAVSTLLDEPHDPVQLRRTFLEVVAARPDPTLMVIDDAHWADTATVDLLRYLGRRMTAVRLMVVLTYRTEEVGPNHPLRVLAGDLASVPVVRRLEVPLLTSDAVAGLTTGTSLDPTDLFRRTGGNPFFVTECLAVDGGVPASVRDAVLARASRLDAGARMVLEATACLGYRVPTALAAEVAGEAVDAVDRCVRSGMLVESDGEVGFRHELARGAIESTISPSRVRRYNQAALVLLATADADDVDPARAAQHAERAGDAAAQLHWARLAAQRAARLGAHRQAADHFERALAVANRVDVTTRADLTEGLALARFLSDQTDRAVDAWRAAADLWRLAGEPERACGALVGLTHTTTLSARWAHAAEAICDEAIETVEDTASPAAVALAYANKAKFEALRRHSADAIALADRALELAPAAEKGAATIYGLMLGGAARVQLGDDGGFGRMEEAVRLARGDGWRTEAGVAYFWLYFATVLARRYDVAARWYGEALAFVTEDDQETWREWLRAFHARALFELGRWDDAEQLAADVQRRATVDDGRRMTAVVTLGRLAARRGDPDASLLLAEVRELMEPAEPVVGWCVNSSGALAEAAWIRGERDAIPGLLEGSYPLARSIGDPWWLGELAYWLDRVDALDQVPDGIALPFELQLAGRPRDAAAAWSALGCPYEAARALLDADDETSVRSALETFDRLGARPARDEAAARLRAMGVTAIPRPKRSGPRRGDALSTRETQVLTFLAEGMRNAEIAEQLFLSERTVEHHVASILRKLGVSDRAEAGRVARRGGAHAERS